MPGTVPGTTVNVLQMSVLNFLFPKRYAKISPSKSSGGRGTMLPGQIVFRNKASILLSKILSSHKHMKDFEKSYNFFPPKLCLIQSFSRFSFSFSPFFPLSLLPFLPSFSGGEWWRGSNPLASHYLGGQNQRNISTLDLPFRLFAFELVWEAEWPQEFSDSIILNIWQI